MVAQNIVVVGANIAGINTAHYLLKHTVPALEADQPSNTYKVTLISPSTHFFWKIGAPRTLASPDLIPFSKIFKPIEDGFKEYPADHFSLVIGSAVGLDEGSQTLTIQNAQSSSKSTINYTALVLATGTTSTSPLWTLHGSHETSVAAMRELHTSLPKASTILIAGGGPAGVETAGEIATLYPSAMITILSGSKSLLPRLKPALGAAAQSKLSDMKVKTLHNVKVTSSSESTDHRTTLNLSDNSIEEVDIYIDATGGKPNSSFLPKSWLNDRGCVLTDPHTLRGPAKHTYAIGDIASYSVGSAMDATDPVRPLASSVLVDLSLPSPNNEKKQKLYKQATSETQVVPIGPKGGVGVVFGWKVPSLMVWAVKSRTYFVEMVEPLVKGTGMVKA